MNMQNNVPNWHSSARFGAFDTPAKFNAAGDDNKMNNVTTAHQLTKLMIFSIAFSVMFIFRYLNWKQQQQFLQWNDHDRAKVEDIVQKLLSTAFWEVEKEMYL